MSSELVIHLNRTNRIPLKIHEDVSLDAFFSEIREEKDNTSDLLCTFQVEFLTDGTDGELVLTLPESELEYVTKRYGYMDLKRVSGGENLPVFNEPLKVKFQKVVTS